MDAWMGIAAFAGGAMLGGWLMGLHHRALRLTAARERKTAARELDEARQAVAVLTRERDAARGCAEGMRLHEEKELSFADGFEAGYRASLEGMRLGDVATAVRMYRARRINQ